jgi:molybdopterin-synthase adenylyltransferase
MKIAVVGCGTSGNSIIPKLQGDILLVDRDIVEAKNLERQKLFSKFDIGKPKSLVLGKKYSCDYKIIDLDFENINLLKGYDLIIDCTDNLETRFLINDFCAKFEIPWIYTGIVGDRARVMVINGNYCLRCLYSEVKGLDTCTTSGVNLDLAEKMSQVVKESIQNLKLSNGLWANGNWLKVSRRQDCPACNGNFEFLSGKTEKILKFCGGSRYQFKGNFDYANVRERLGGVGNWFVYQDFYIFTDRVLVKAKSEKEAKEKFSKTIGN